MALNSRQVMDPRWVSHHRNLSSSFQVCDIDIYNEQLASREYNATTNTWDTDSTVMWSGKARIQPTKISSERNIPGNPSFVRQVVMQIDFNKNQVEGSNGAMADIRPGNYILVTNSPYDQLLTKFVYIVRTVMGSSNPWQRTITCEVDMESDPDV
jgi:hypothetical protein